jgi:hypothetical protein
VGDFDLEDRFFSSVMFNSITQALLISHTYITLWSERISLLNSIIGILLITATGSDSLRSLLK